MSSKIKPGMVYSTATILVLCAVVATSLRILFQTESDLPTGDTAWAITISQEIEALEKNALIRISPPWDTRHARLYAQTLTHPGLRQRRTKSDRRERNIVLTTPNPGYYRVESVFKLHVSPLAFTEPKRPGLSETNRATWLSDEADTTVNSPIAKEIVSQYSHTSPDARQLIDRLYNHVSSEIRIDSTAGSTSDAALNSNRATRLGMTRALVALLRTAHLPARIVSGIDLHTASKKQPVYWAEVYDGQQWIVLDPVRGYLDELPAFHIPMRKDNIDFVTAEGATISATEISISPITTDDTLITVGAGQPADILNLNRLAPGNRETLAILLLLPLGVFATEVFRQFAGVRTYGTFTPALLALAVTHVAWTTAVTVLLLVIAIGFVIRASMPDLELHRTPRLAIVFTLVALSMTMVVSGMSYFDPSMDSSVVLLPVVILTMLVDRIYTLYDEKGARVALLRLVWTLLASVISLLVLLQSDWGKWLVSYPELHALTLAAIILIGLYNGPRLKDLPAFGWLREPARDKHTRSGDSTQSGQDGGSR